MTANTLLILEFVKGRDGRPIARLPSGKIALPTRESKLPPEVGKRFLCSLSQERERYALVNVLARAVYADVTVYSCGHVREERKEAREGEEDVVLAGKKVSRFEGDILLFGCPQCRERARHSDHQADIQVRQVRIQEIEKKIREKIRIVDRIQVHEEYRAEVAPDYFEGDYFFDDGYENTSVQYLKLRADKEITNQWGRRRREEAAIENIVKAVYAEKYIECVGSDNHTESEELADDKKYQKLKEGIERIKEVRVTLYEIQCKVVEKTVPEAKDEWKEFAFSAEVVE